MKVCLKADPSQAEQRSQWAEHVLQREGAKTKRSKFDEFRFWAETEVANTGGKAAHKATRLKTKWVEDLCFEGCLAEGVAEIKALEE